MINSLIRNILYVIAYYKKSDIDQFYFTFFILLPQPKELEPKREPAYMQESSLLKWEGSPHTWEGSQHKQKEMTYRDSNPRGSQVRTDTLYTRVRSHS